MTGLRSFLHLAAVVSLGGIATLTGLIGAAYGVLQTNPGRHLATPVIESGLNAALDMEAAIDGLAEFSLDRVRMGELSLGDRRSPWLSAVGIDMAWRPMALLAGNLSISSLTVDRLTLHRPPPDSGGPATTGDFRPPIAIALEHLAVTELHIERPVLGEAATLEIEGQASAREDGTGTLRLDIVRRDGPGGQLSARADYGLATRRLDLGLSLDEPKDGVLARLFDLPGRPAISLKLDGAGSLDDWRGRLTGAAAGLMSLDAAVGLALDSRLSVAVDGKADVAGILPEDLRALAAPEVNVVLKAAWEPEGARLEITEGRFSNTALEGTISGTIDGNSLRANGKATLRLLDAGTLAALTAPAKVQAGEATVTVDGSFTRPAGRIEARIAGLALPGVTAGTGQAAADFEMADGLGGAVTLRGSGRLSGLETAEQSLGSVVGSEIGIEAEARIRPEGDIDLTTAVIQAAGGKASLSGTVTADGIADLAGTLDLPDLAALNSLLGLPVKGQASAVVALRLAADDLRGTVAADIHRLALPAAGPAAALLGPEVTLAGDISSDPSKGWRFDNLSVDGRSLSATGRAAFSRDFADVDAEYRMRLRDLSVLTAQMSGEATLSGNAGGKVAAPWVKGRVAAERVGIAGQALRDLRIDYRFDDFLEHPRGRLNASLRSPWDSVAVQADTELTNRKRLAIRNIDAATLGTRLSGEIEVDMTSALADGRITLAAADLRPWSTVLGTPLAGRLDTAIALSSQAGKQNVKMELDGSQLRAGADGETALAANRISASLLVGDALGDRQVDARGRLTDGLLGPLRFDVIEAGTQGQPERLDIALSGTGPSVTFKTAGTLTIREPAIELGLASLSGSAYGQRFSLVRPAHLRRTADELGVTGLQLRVADGTVETDLRLTPETFQLDGRLRRLPLSLVALARPDFKMTGTVDGEIRLTGAAASPTGQFSLSTQDATVSVGGEPVAVRARADGSLDAAGALALKAGIEGPGDARLTLDGRVPVRMSLAPASLTVAEDRPLAATVVGQGDLSALLGPMVPDPHVVNGDLDLRMEVSGNLSSPRTDGDIRIAGGRYENIVSGTLVRDIALEAQFNGDRLDIVRASGLAGSGRIEGTGTLGLKMSEGLPIDVRIRAEKAGVVHRDDLSLAISGDIALGGSLEKPALNGKLTVVEAELRLVDKMPPTVVALDVVEVNAQTPQKAEAPAGRAAPQVDLDLAIAVPGRLFVRGQGMDSEWSGSLRLTGSTEAPRVTGQLTPVRGQVSFAGKTFVLQQGSTVAFRDPSSTTPVLNVTAEHQGSDFTARFVIRGPVDNPELTLSSSPELPQDEIVSRILFGRGVAKVSAIEAAQLAQAVASLSGKGGPDFLETARRALGVDVLRVEAGEGDNGPAVTAGRYLSQDVYVGVSQGAGAKSGEARVEVEVTPNVTIESEVGPTSGGQIGARWKLDY